MQKSRVAVLGATGMVGQRLLVLLENHPYFDVVKLAACFSSLILPVPKVSMEIEVGSATPMA